MRSGVNELEHAVSLHRRGELSRARMLYEEILAQQPAHFDALHLLGVVATQTRDLGRALELFERALAVDPGNAAAHFNRGTALQALKRNREALASYRRAIEIDPGFAEALVNQAAVQLELGDGAAALASCDRAIAIRRGFAEAWFNRGNALRQLEQREAALDSYDAAIAVRAEFAEVWFNRGNLQRELNQLAAALASYDRALAIKPDYAAAHANGGNLRRELKQWQAALASYDRLIVLRPLDPIAHLNRGLVLLELDDWLQALASFDRAIACQAEFAEAHLNRGLALKMLDRLEDALASCDRAIALRPAFAEAYSGRGAVQDELGLWEEALASFDRAMEIDPALVAAYVNRAHVLRELDRHSEALRSVNEAIALQADFAPAHLNKSILLLSAGDYENGWREFEWRLKNVHSRSSRERRHYAQPLWLGESGLAGKRLLVHGEQGLGDAIQFCRYVGRLAAQGARVVLEAPQSLAALFESLEGAPHLVLPGEPLPEFDCYCPLLSLPLACRTTLSSLPAAVPYLRPAAERVSHWRGRLGERTRFRVGLVWASGERREQPEVRGANRRRNIPLSKLIRLQHPQIEFYSLQKGQPAELELARSLSEWGPAMRDFTSELRDFSDTAALMEPLDLIISVDTATAHLAGALGKPVWILLRSDACWRWLRDRTDSPWYPTARLYRQERPGDWDGVVQRVRRDLEALLRGSGSSAGPP